MNWTDPRHRRFEADLKRAGYEVVEYHGRWAYHGPSVKVDASELQGVLRSTPVRVVWDTLGKSGLVVYPDCSRRIEEQKDLLRFDEALKDFGVEWNREGTSRG